MHKDLILAVSVDKVVSAALVLKNLFRTEEAFQLNLSVLYRVRGMNNVLLVAQRIVATNSTRSSGTAIGGTSHGAYNLHSLYAFECQSYNRRSLHGGCKGGEEGAVNQVSIVFAQDLVAELHELQTGDAESAAFKTIDNFSNQLALYTAGLQ